MNTSTQIGILSVFIFLGVFLGLLLSFFFILKPSSNTAANRYQGLLLLSLSLCILEQFLNITGYIVHVLALTNATEPLNLIIGPFLYLFIKRSLDPANPKGEWIHFILFFLYFIYIWFDLIQTNEFKYNSYVNSYHPDWPLLDVEPKISNDPLNIKNDLNLITSVQILFYVSISVLKLAKKASGEGESIFTTGSDMLISLRNLALHVLIIAIIFIVVKINFQGDLGDYFIGMYVSFFTLLTTIRVMNDSTYFDRTATFMDISIGKYRKSSVNETIKKRILDGIDKEFVIKEYYADNLASLPDLAKKIGESPHHVSQVINEKLGKNFFELLAYYRIEKAKMIFQEDKQGKLTIEEISEMVGYNSKTAFNNSFKKLTDKTPSEFRKSVNN